jgi:hypothetical protein
MAMYDAERKLAKAARTAESTAAAVEEERAALRSLSQALRFADPSFADDLGVELLALVNRLEDRRTGARRMSGYVHEVLAFAQAKGHGPIVSPESATPPAPQQRTVVRAGGAGPS